MILGFKEYFDKKKTQPTWFREKILLGADKRIVVASHHIAFDKRRAGYVLDVSKVKIDEFKPKLHTLRSDPHNRWKPGMSIQMVYRGPNYSILDYFNKGIPELDTLKSKQKISIEFNDRVTMDCRPCRISIDNIIYWEGFVLKSGTSCGSQKELDKIEILSNNDGSENSIQFFRWFNKDWEGYILHWTDLRY